MNESVNRRGALKKVSLVVGGAAMSPLLLSVFQSCQEVKEPLNWSPIFFDEMQAKIVMQLAELIIPETDSPGSIQAGVHVFIDSFVQHCMPKETQDFVVEGLQRVNEDASVKFGGDFTTISLADQTALLKEESAITPTEEGESSFFQVFKRLTMTGYFNSQKGASEALIYVDIPGDYLGCIDLEEGQKSWAI